MPAGTALPDGEACTLHPATFPSHLLSPFSAIAVLLAGSLKRAEKSAGTVAHVDVTGIQQRQHAAATLRAGEQQAVVSTNKNQEQQQHQHQQQPQLTLEDDAAGLSPQLLRRMCAVPQRANTSATSVTLPPAGGGTAPKWTDFVHAVLRLGSTALVLTKRRGAGASVAVVRCCADGRDGEQIVQAAVVDFSADGSRQLAASSKAAAPVAGSDAGCSAAPTEPAAAAAWQAALNAIQQSWGGSGSEAGLREQLAGMPEQGTRLVIARLQTTSTSSCGSASPAAAPPPCYDLDWGSDAGDLRAAPHAALAGALEGGTGQDAQPNTGEWELFRFTPLLPSAPGWAQPCHLVCGTWHTCALPGS